MDELKKLHDENLSEISGGKGKVSMTGGKDSIWRPVCPNCNKEMVGGIGVIRIKKDGAEHPYFCTQCAEKFLNSGEAVIDPGFEKYYKKYEKSINQADGSITYGWKKV